MTENAMYVYGIVPADVEIEPGARGVGDPPAEVKTVRHGRISALVSPIDPGKPLGRPRDLTAHSALLDGASVACPVLPMRFGAVLTDEQAVIDELLAEHEDEFAEALHELEGKAEYVLKGRYDEVAILNEILDENPALVRLREAIRDKPEDATRNERIALGEHISNAIAAKRQIDTDTMARVLTEQGVLINVREPTHEEDAFNIACLTEIAKQADLEAAVDQLAREWEGRVGVRLLGPLAPYDFVVTRTGT
ncbi:GvpL/GvpF family gas vesicle protein [Amycolatopsis taiwanensis]|uniref:Gas vesicle protein n=1 Tax=Amycolatopsis taiwanensis TaxID=342230 RepID=A0A9W6QYD7_9PSEU|nr:GvpL/GvpF family gas vesicle protein [Amycolatopsis taiwanensis]GLY65130.1 gas vesicle protein [Amycolatopsis taiwanensis]